MLKVMSKNIRVLPENVKKNIQNRMSSRLAVVKS